MKFEDIHIGDVLQIRSWEDMALEFGEKNGFQGSVIQTSPALFVSKMKYLCGKVFTVWHIDERRCYICSAEGYELSSYPENPVAGRDWIIVASMLRPFIPNTVEDSFDSVDLSGFLM